MRPGDVVHGLALTVLCCVVTGCEAGRSSVTPISTPSVTPTAVTPTATWTSSASPSPIVSPTPSITPTVTPILPTPRLPLSTENEFPFSEFFFDNHAYPGCDLPCWKGLTVGKSGSGDVQQIFDNEFGFNGMLNFRSDGLFSDKRLLNHGFDNMSGRYAFGHDWVRKGAPEGFAVIAIFDQGTDLLQTLDFNWNAHSDSVLSVAMTPQDVIRWLGNPDHMLASVELSEVSYAGSAYILMVYDTGIVFELFTTVPVVVSEDGKNPTAVAEFCLGSNTVKINTGFMVADLYLLDPFTDGLDNLSPLQDMVVGRDIRERELVSFEEAFGLSPQEVMELTSQGGDNCIYSENLLGN